MIPATLDLTIYRGATFGPILITFLDDSGVAINLTGWNVFSDARGTVIRPVAFSLGAVFLNAVGGQVTLSKTDDQTNEIVSGDYGWDLFLENPAGERLGPFISGQVSVLGVYTQP